MSIYIIIFTLLITANSVFAEKIDYMRENRERLIRIETILSEFKDSVDKRFDAVDKRFEAVDRRFNELINIFLGIVAAFACIVAVTIGFAIWDRKTTVEPIKKDNNSLAKREEKVEQALKEFAEKEPIMRDVLRKVGIL